MTFLNGDKIKISPREAVRDLFLLLLGAELLIALADILLYQLKWLPWSKMRTAFNITREDTIVNWFSSTQEFLVALVLLAIFLLSRRAKQKWAWGWAVLAAFLALISLDDGSNLHENMGSTFGQVAYGTHFTAWLANNFPSYYWQLVLGPVLLAMTIFMGVFLWKQIGERRFFYWIVVGVCLLALAVMLDFAEGMDAGLLAIRFYKHNSKLLEEFLEMLGNSVFLVTFLQVLMQKFPTIKLRFLSGK